MLTQTCQSEGRSDYPQESFCGHSSPSYCYFEKTDFRFRGPEDLPFADPDYIFWINLRTTGFRKLCKILKVALVCSNWPFYLKLMWFGWKQPNDSKIYMQFTWKRKLCIQRYSEDRNFIKRMYFRASITMLTGVPSKIWKNWY